VAFRLDKIVVFGVGLIGGSFALALKRAGVVSEVVGIGRSQATLDEALRLGLIDRIGACDAATLRDAAAHFDMVRCGIAVYGMDPFGEDPDRHGLEPALAMQWIVQPHLFTQAFYYVEYGIAQVGALQVWRNYRSDPVAAVAADCAAARSVILDIAGVGELDTYGAWPIERLLRGAAGAVLPAY